MNATDVFTITHLSYDETTDTLTARAFESQHFDNEPVADEESDVHVVITLGADAASIDVDTAQDHDFSFGPAVLTAFARAWQDAHDKQNPGDSPALTQLERFTVTY